MSENNEQSIADKPQPPKTIGKPVKTEFLNSEKIYVNTSKKV